MDIGHIARRFPLVARPRPACPPLAERVQAISRLARSAEQGTALPAAAVAQNMAALTVSDCGLPDLARLLCWRHAETYLRAQPLRAQEARLALEPLVNLARLHIRADDGRAGYQLLSDLNTAVTARRDAVLDGRHVPLANLTATEHDHRDVRRWLYAVLLGDGLRALAAAGDWERAREHARRNRGVGNRLLDGRQVETISLFLDGDTAGAVQFANSSTPREPWEQPVLDCLTMLCLTAANTPGHATKAVTSFFTLTTGPELAMFRARLGLTVADLCDRHGHAASTDIRARLLRTAVEGTDGYVARELLRHEPSRTLATASQLRDLRALADRAGLDLGHIPTDLKSSLLDAVNTSAAVTERHLRTV